MKKFHQKKLFIFDLDGVIFDSKSNMKVAWNETSNKFNLNTPFYLYFKKIGMPFSDILKSLGLINDDRIYRYFQKISLKKISLIKPYKDAIDQLKILKKNKIKFSIVTSKDLKRTKYLLKKFNIKPDTIHCPNSELKGKPYPDHLLNSMKVNEVNSEQTCFVGDTEIDYLAAKNASIDFIFATYGYGKKKEHYKYLLENFKKLNKYLKVN